MSAKPQGFTRKPTHCRATAKRMCVRDRVPAVVVETSRTASLPYSPMCE